MAYLVDMRKTCTNRATNPEFPLDLLKSISGEFDKGLNGGIFDASYVLAKLKVLNRHVKWLEVEAEKEWQTEIEDDNYLREEDSHGPTFCSDDPADMEG